jgi:hypothetical protein
MSLTVYCTGIYWNHSWNGWMNFWMKFIPKITRVEMPDRFNSYSWWHGDIFLYKIKLLKIGERTPYHFHDFEGEKIQQQPFWEVNFRECDRRTKFQPWPMKIEVSEMLYNTSFSANKVILLHVLHDETIYLYYLSVANKCVSLWIRISRFIEDATSTYIMTYIQMALRNWVTLIYGKVFLKSPPSSQFSQLKGLRFWIKQCT